MTQGQDHSDALRLSALMVPDESALPSWGEADLAELWEHQLSSAVPELSGASFRDVLHGPSRSPAALEAVVRFARARLDDSRSPFPAAIAEALFQAGRVLLGVKHDIDTGAVEGGTTAGLTAVLVVPWLDATTRSILSETEDPGAGIVDPDLHESAPLVDGYEVIGPLGAGGMGTVWRARQLSTRRDVALKLMSAATLGSHRARDRFEREVELASRLQHPNIARIYDSGLSRGIWFYAMELIDGRRLDDYVRETRLGRRHALELMVAVCRAVQHAHERGVIHRDLKPSNILVSADGQPHLLDFGLAKAVAGAAGLASVTVSMQGDIAGTLGFIAPEQLAGSPDAADTRGDVYSLGVILYLLALGRPPHDLGGPHFQVMRRLHEQEAPRPRSLDATIDAELEAIMLKAMEKEPARRYPAAGALADDLVNHLQGEPITARPPTLAYFLNKRAKKHRLLISIASTAAAVVLAVIAWAYIRIASERNQAVAAKVLAEAARRSADEQRRQADAQRQLAEERGRAAEHERQNAQARLAESLLAHGDAMAQASRWIEAKASYQESCRTLIALGKPTFAADTGLATAFGPAPPPLNVYSGHTAAVIATAFSSDAALAVSGSEDQTVRLWDVVTGRLIRTFTGFSAAVTSVDISPAGDSVLGGGDDGTIRLWDLATGREMRVFHQKKKISRVRYAPRGGRAVSASLDGTACVWDLASGACICSVRGPDSNPLRSVAFSPDCLKCLSCTQSFYVTMWDATTGQVFNLGSPPFMHPMDVAFSDDGRWALAGYSAFEATSPRDLQLWDLTAGGAAAPGLTTNGRGAQRVGFSHNGAQVLSVSGDGVIQVWDLASGALLRSIWGDGAPLREVSFSKSGHLALSGAGPSAADHTMKLWDIGPCHAPLDTKQSPATTSLALSGDGRVAAVVSENVVVDLIDTATGHRLRRLGDGTMETHHVAALSSDGRRMLEGVAFDVRLWDVATGQVITLGRHDDTVRAVAFSPDGRFALSHSGNQLAYWDIGERKPLWKIKFSRVLGRGIGFSPDGTRAVGVNTHGAAMYWELPSGRFFPVPGYFNDGHVPSELGAAFTAGGARVLNARENDVVLSDAFTGVPLSTFTGHTGRVNAVAASADGAWAASVGGDGTARIWDLEQRREVRALSCGAVCAESVAITPDGRWLMAGGKDGVLHRWDLSLPAVCRDIQPELDRARAALQKNPDDLIALALLGRCYALRGADAWAVDLLERARAGGADVPALLLARCYWGVNNNAAAAIEFQRALDRGEAPRPYLELCISAARREGTPSASGPAETRPAE